MKSTVKPARWRKARFPEAGTRWATPMNRFVWERDHSGDIELWRGETKLAVVTTQAKWTVCVGSWPRAGGKAETIEEAKSLAKARALDAETGGAA